MVATTPLDEVAGAESPAFATRRAPSCVAARGPVVVPPAAPGAAAAAFAATHPVPRAFSAGGPVLASPHLVPIVFRGDPLTRKIEDFVGSIGCTDYWHAAVGEYGVGDALAHPIVELDEDAPDHIADDQVKAWLAAHASSLPAADDPSALYVLFYPQRTTITLSGATSCVDFGGYHDDVALERGRDPRLVAFAVLPRCARFSGESDEIDALTAAAIHELVEAVTDPLPSDAPSYAETTSIAWDFTFGGELGDLCEHDDDRTFRPAGYPYVVQRIWSNAAASLGGSPCAPRSRKPFFTAAPRDLGDVSFAGHATPGVIVPAGATRTLLVDLYSDDPDADIELSVDADDDPDVPAATAVSLPRGVGKSGESLLVTLDVAPGRLRTESDILYFRVAQSGRRRLAGAIIVAH